MPLPRRMRQLVRRSVILQLPRPHLRSWLACTRRDKSAVQHLGYLKRDRALDPRALVIHSAVAGVVPPHRTLPRGTLCPHLHKITVEDLPLPTPRRRGVPLA